MRTPMHGGSSERTGRQYRLLSEAEWEYAARAGTTTTRFWGDAADRACEYANGADVSTRTRRAGHEPSGRSRNATTGTRYTAPVGSYRANAFGLHDMLGNVWEWTQDCWNANYDGAPADGRSWSTGECALRAVRGGSWEDAPLGCACRLSRRKPDGDSRLHQGLSRRRDAVSSAAMPYVR